MKKLIIFVAVTLLFSGCGGSSGSSSGGGSTSPRNTEMEIGQPYSVYKGDAIVKNTEDALLTIVHVDGQSDSTVTLKQGSATLTRQ